MKMKNWMRSAGFTLVELIVVIAVLGILGAGAAVGYSGYVKKANKAADEALVAQIKYALEVAQVSDPMPDGAAAVVLSQTGAAVTGTTDADNPSATSWVTNAMTDAFGANWANELKLQYGEWGKGAAVSKNVLEFFSGITEASDKGVYDVVNGKAVPSFANDVDELFELIRDTAIDVNGAIKGDSGARLIQNAAGLTAGEGAIKSDKFAEAWAQQAWDSSILMDDAGNYNVDTIKDAQGEPTNSTKAAMLASAVANAGVIKARNTSLATYLRDNGVPELYSFFANYSLKEIKDGEEENTSIPDDALGKLLNGSTQDAMRQGMLAAFSGLDADTKAQKLESVYSLIDEYLGYSEDSDEPDTVNSQAYKDGLAYYTMMKTVGTVNEDNANDATYWNEMAGAVSLYGSVARRDADLNTLKDALSGISENNVVILATKGGNFDVTEQPSMEG